MGAGPSTHDEAGEFLERCVALYNAGVLSRDFSGFLALLNDDAVFDFEGTTERGPLGGKVVIAQHFADDPPDDGIRVKRWKCREGEIAAEFGWLDIPEGGGCLFIQLKNGRISHLTIAMGGPRRTFR